MAQLTNARRQATSIRTLIRQKKYMPAIQALYDTVLTMLKNPLMKSEKEEFERLITDGTYHIMGDSIIRKSAALEIKYTPGQERELLDSLRILLEAFQEGFQQKANDAMRLAQELRERELAKGQSLLDANKLDDSRSIFSDLAKANKNDCDLLVDIGDRFLRSAHYEDAAFYLGDALSLNPNAVHIYNRLAMAQRKLGNFAEAEKCYLKAAQGGYKDPHLFFNIGRLYIDWEKWEKAIKAANGALTLDPGFEEAQKLKTYAEKMLDPSAD